MPPSANASIIVVQRFGDVKSGTLENIALTLYAANVILAVDLLS